MGQGKLLLQRCSACNSIPNYPRITCSRCFAPLDWFEAGGSGTIRSYAVLHRTHSVRYAEYLPIVLVRVELDAGTEMISTLIGSDRLEATIGAQVIFAGSNGWSTLPQFRLAKPPAGERPPQAAERRT